MSALDTMKPLIEAQNLAMNVMAQIESNRLEEILSFRTWAWTDAWTAHRALKLLQEQGWGDLIRLEGSVAPIFLVEIGSAIIR